MLVDEKKKKMFVSFDKELSINYNFLFDFNNLIVNSLASLYLIIFNWKGWHIKVNISEKFICSK